MTGDEVEVEFDAEPPVVAEPADFARALDAEPVARAAYDRLAYSHKREHVLANREREEAGDARPADREGRSHAAATTSPEGVSS